MSLLQTPTTVLEIAATLEKAGFETWCVGGAVRDALLGHPDLDWDLATAATPDQVQRLFRRTVPVGIRFGTVGVLDRNGRMHEVTTFRRDIETDGRHAVVRFGASLDDDLARRDLTINAIAYSPSRDAFHDPFDGRRDLEGQLIRAVGDPRERMREDRLRALRALRFASRFGFEIEPATWSAIVESAPHLGRLSPERVKQELEKTMEQVARPSEAFARWETSGSFATLIPALAGTDAVLRSALDHVPQPIAAGPSQRRMNRLATLFLGVAGSRLTRTLRDLRFSNTDAAWIVDLVGRWQSLSAEMEREHLAPAPPSSRVIRQWVAAAGRTRIRSLLRVAYAVWRARGAAGMRAPEPARVRSVYRAAVRAAYRDPVEIADLAIDGDDLVAAGFASGPQVGKILRALLAIVIDDPARNTRDELMAAAKGLSQESTE